MARDSVAASIGYQVVDLVLGRVVTAALSIFIARLLSPNDYGVVAIVSVFISLSEVIVQSGLSLSLVQKKEVDSLDYSTVFILSWFFSVIVYFLLYAISPFVAEVYAMPSLVLLIRVQGVAVFAAPINSVATAYAKRTMSFKQLTVSHLLSSMASSVFAVILAYKGFGVWALVIQAISQRLLSAILLLAFVKWKPSLMFSASRARPLLSFGCKSLFSDILNQLFSQVSTLVIGGIFSRDSLAFYQQGSTYPRTIVESMNNAVQNVIIVPMSRAVGRNDVIISYCRKANSMLALVVAPAMFGLAAISPTLVPVLLTDNWSSLAPYLAAFSVLYSFYPLLSSGYQVLMALGKSGLYLRFNVLSKSFSMVSLFLAVFIFRNPLAIVIINIAGNLVLLIVNAILIERNIAYTARAQIKDVAVYYIVAAIMAAVVYVLNFVPLVIEPVRLLIQLIVGAVVYTLIMALLKPPAYQHALEKLRSVFAGMRKMGRLEK